MTNIVTGSRLGYRSTLSVTRPANTTAYTTGDVIGVADATVAANAGSAILTFAGIGPVSNDIEVISTDLRIDLAAVPATMTSFRLHLYDASPTAILDNAAWDLPLADRVMYLGYLDLGTPVDVGSTLYVRTDNIHAQFRLAEGATVLYGELVLNGGYTPTSAATLQIRINARAI